MKQWTILSVAFALTLGLMDSATMGQASDAGSGVSAAVISKVLKAMGYTAKINSDESGDPRVKTTVDGFKWDIFFYDCGTGALEERGCASFQFYSGYTVPQGFSMQIINKWNTEKRYAKAYMQVLADKSNNARIEVDVLVAGTLADPAQMFRAFFAKMKVRAEEFRAVIGCSNHCAQKPTDSVPE
jgi:ABC-type proline/glycine betaine transport system substrate-binding protein